jgi:hypothetical protein
MCKNNFRNITPRITKNSILHSKTSPENTKQKSDTHKNGIAFFIGKEELKRNRAAKFSSPLQPPNTKNHIKNPFLIRQIGVIRGQ